MFADRRATLVVVPFLVASCSFNFSAGGGSIDYDKLESRITEELNRAYEPMGETVGEVTCPEQSDPKPNDKFVCDADLKGDPVRVEVTLKDDEGNVDIKTLDLVYDLGDMETLLDKEIEAQVGFPVTVECDRGLAIVPVGDTFTCTAIDRQSAEKTVEVTAEGLNDTTWRLLD